MHLCCAGKRGGWDRLACRLHGRCNAAKCQACAAARHCTRKQVQGYVQRAITAMITARSRRTPEETTPTNAKDTYRNNTHTHTRGPHTPVTRTPTHAQPPFRHPAAPPVAPPVLDGLLFDERQLKEVPHAHAGRAQAQARGQAVGQHQARHRRLQLLRNGGQHLAQPGADVRAAVARARGLAQLQGGGGGSVGRGRGSRTCVDAGAIWAWLGGGGGGVEGGARRAGGGGAAGLGNKTTTRHGPSHIPRVCVCVCGST